MTKLCGRCRRLLPLSNFHRYHDDFQPWCKACKSEYAAAYYVRNKARRLEYNNRRRRAAREWYQGLKSGKPCADCKCFFDPAAMQWDHLPGAVKVADVAGLFARGSHTRVLEEIDKCKLVCANCHAVRTAKRADPSPCGRA